VRTSRPARASGPRLCEYVRVNRERHGSSKKPGRPGRRNKKHRDQLDNAFWKTSSQATNGRRRQSGLPGDFLGARRRPLGYRNAGEFFPRAIGRRGFPANVGPSSSATGMAGPLRTSRSRRARFAPRRVPHGRVPRGRGGNAARQISSRSNGHGAIVSGRLQGCSSPATTPVPPLSVV